MLDALAEHCNIKLFHVSVNQEHPKSNSSHYSILIYSTINSIYLTSIVCMRQERNGVDHWRNEAFPHLIQHFNWLKL
jgi:hypothetical protein